MGWKTRLGLGVLCAAAIAGPIAFVLSAHVPSVVETALIEPSQALEGVPIELSYRDYPGRIGTHSAAIVLQLERVDALVRHPRLDLLVGTYDTSPRLVRATLTVEGTDCAYTSRPRAAFPNNGTVGLLRARECARITGTPTGRMLLEVSFDGPGRVGVWSYRAPAEPIDPNRIYLTDPTYAERGVLCELRGHFIDEFGRSPMRRIDLLAYVWQVRGARPAWIWIALGGCGLLIVLAGLLLPGPSGIVAPLRAAVAAGLAAGAVALLYAVLIPPFQGPDEPSHFLGYGYVTGNTALSPAVATWAQLTHFQRIRFNPDEQFRADNVGRPYSAGWDAITTLDFTRSSVPVRTWRALAPWLSTRSIPAQFLLLRLSNVLLFATAAALCAIGLWAGGFRSSLVIAVLPLVVPTVPFLAMHVSNYAFLVAAYVLLASGTAMMMLDGRASSASGWLLGPGLAVALASSRSGMPMLPFVGMLAAARILLSRPADRAWLVVQPLVFWSGLAAGLVLLSSLITPEHGRQIQGELTATAGTAGLSLYLWVMSHAVSAGLAVCVIGTGFEIAIQWVRARLGPASAAVRSWLHRGSALLAVAVLALLAASSVVALPVLHPGARGVTSPLRYAAEAALSAATLFRIAHHDLLLSSTFWAGLGWLDTYPPAVITLLAGVSGLLLAHGLLLARLRHRAWIVISGGAVLATVAIYAVAALQLSPDVHGRYVIGAYLAGLYAIWTAGGDAQAGGSAWRAGALTATTVIAHVLALTTVVTRYF